MQNAEGILVLSSIIFAVVFRVVMAVRRPRQSLKAWYMGESVQFDKNRIPAYLKLLAVVIVASAMYGYVVAQRLLLTLEFAGLNLGIAAILGVSFVLYQPRRSTK